MNSLEMFLVGVVIILAIVAGLFAWKLYRTGTPKDQLFGQTKLKAEDILDAMEDRMIQALHTWTEAHPAKMKASYFDVDDFIMDIGRLPDTFTATIKLDTEIKRAGSLEVLQYRKAANGNVLRVQA